jgi:hypothetical protein
MPISNLLSASRDPTGYLWASGGIVACGLCGLLWTTVLWHRWNHEATPAQRRGTWALLLGNFFMACSAMPPHRLVGLSKGHEILVLLAFTGLCLGVVDLMFLELVQIFQQGMLGSVQRQRLYAAILACLAVLPILLTGLAQAYVYYALPGLNWVSLSWRARGVPMYLSFAFWEWITCITLSAYMATLVLLPKAVSGSASD